MSKPNLDNCTIIKDGRREIKVQEDRRLCDFLTIPLKDMPKAEEYQGWYNATTCLFNTYFMQEEGLREKLWKLRKKDGTINYHKAVKLFILAQNMNLMEQVDDDCEGPVCVQEIVDFFLQERKN